MSCGFCAHWVEDKDQPQRIKDVGWFENWSQKGGECALHPQRQKTTSNYFCSQLRMSDPSLPVYWRERLSGAADERRLLCERIKKLEQRKKLLNDKVRELRKQASVSEQPSEAES